MCVFWLVLLQIGALCVCSVICIQSATYYDATQFNPWNSERPLPKSWKLQNIVIYKVNTKTLLDFK